MALAGVNESFKAEEFSMKVAVTKKVNVIRYALPVVGIQGNLPRKRIRSTWSTYCYTVHTSFQHAQQPVKDPEKQQIHSENSKRLGIFQMMNVDVLGKFGDT